MKKALLFIFSLSLFATFAFPQKNTDPVRNDSLIQVIDSLQSTDAKLESRIDNLENVRAVEVRLYDKASSNFDIVTWLIGLVITFITLISGGIAWSAKSAISKFDKKVEQIATSYNQLKTLQSEIEKTANTAIEVANRQLAAYDNIRKSMEKVTEREPETLAALDNMIKAAEHARSAREYHEKEEAKIAVQTPPWETIRKAMELREIAGAFLNNRIDEQPASTLYFRAMAFVTLNQRTEMLEALEKAIVADPKYAEDARTSGYFREYYSDPDFIALVGTD